jgi:riboflavin kinase/FMN adenylyltransferase
LYVSRNFKFGSKRQGNIQTLKKFERKFNYKNIITNPYKQNKKMISSTFIRKKIRAGKIVEINKLLNRRWCIEGRVIKGKKRGRKIGFPTCNMDLSSYVVPKLGVYAVKVNFGKLNKDGIANIGFRPTFKGQSLLLETNIFGINKNLYNKVLSISFKKFIRPEKKFRNFEYLRKQIKLDIKQAKK